MRLRHRSTSVDGGPGCGLPPSSPCLWWAAQWLARRTGTKTWHIERTPSGGNRKAQLPQSQRCQGCFMVSFMESFLKAGRASSAPVMRLWEQRNICNSSSKAARSAASAGPSPQTVRAAGGGNGSDAWTPRWGINAFATLAMDSARGNANAATTSSTTPTPPTRSSWAGFFSCASMLIQETRSSLRNALATAFQTVGVSALGSKSSAAEAALDPPRAANDSAGDMLGAAPPRHQRGA
mmetsp:Transcript_73075/g.161664  ORF Transcript_73075/g.161664 Transcript_73075/m.161664 type:complete len:237 (+) Transcript_73075:695-1405(+)